jgi:hypothetical protein
MSRTESNLLLHAASSDATVGSPYGHAPDVRRAPDAAAATRGVCSTSQLWEARTARASAGEAPQVMHRELAAAHRPSPRIAEMSRAVADALARAAAAQLDVDAEAARIGGDAVEGEAYLANGHTELAKLPSAERCRLLAAFRTNTRVRILELTNCGLDNAAAATLADVLSGAACGLTAVNLERNQIGSEGILALAAMLPRNCGALRELKLAYQSRTISSAAELELSRALERNGGLLKLTQDARQTEARELRDKWLWRNAEARRIQRRAVPRGDEDARAGGGASAAAAPSPRAADARDRGACATASVDEPRRSGGPSEPMSDASERAPPGRVRAAVRACDSTGGGGARGGAAAAVELAAKTARDGGDDGRARHAQPATEPSPRPVLARLLARLFCCGSRRRRPARAAGVAERAYV